MVTHGAHGDRVGLAGRGAHGARRELANRGRGPGKRAARCPIPGSTREEAAICCHRCGARVSWHKGTRLGCGAASMQHLLPMHLLHESRRSWCAARICTWAEAMRPGPCHGLDHAMVWTMPWPRPFWWRARGRRSCGLMGACAAGRGMGGAPWGGAHVHQSGGRVACSPDGLNTWMRHGSAWPECLLVMRCKHAPWLVKP
jgi:hypothetical protein